MADRTGIEWTDATWNPIVGCSVVSPGCTNCYAMKMAARIEAMQPGSHYAGTTQASKAGAVWTGKLALAPDSILTQPLRWRRPRRIFVNSMGDLFHEDVPDAWIDRVFAVMALTPQHTYQVLTKRSARMRAYFAETGQVPAKPALRIDDTLTVPAQPARIEDRWERINHVIDDVIMDPIFEHDRFWTPGGALIGRPAWPRRPLPNVWLGVSTEDQRRADERVPDLCETPAAVRFISAEPLLGAIDLRRVAMPAIKYETGIHYQDVLRAGSWSPRMFFRPAQPDEPQNFFTSHSDTNRIDLVIAGGESGPKARPMHPDWARSLRDQCAAAGTAFFFKQWGEWVSTYDRDRDDPDWRSVPKPGDWDRKRFLNLAGGQGFHGDKLHMMRRVGKHAAGRLLDGVEHNAMPEVL